MFTLNVGIECLNRIKDVQKESVINVFEYPRRKVSLKDVKVELKTRLFKVNIQILLEGLMFIIKC